MSNKQPCVDPPGAFPYGPADHCAVDPEMFKEWPVCMMVGGGMLVVANILNVCLAQCGGKANNDDTVVKISLSSTPPQKCIREIKFLISFFLLVGSVVFAVGMIGSIVTAAKGPHPNYKKYPCRVGPGEGSDSLVITDRENNYGRKADCSKVGCNGQTKYCMVL